MNYENYVQTEDADKIHTLSQIDKISLLFKIMNVLTKLEDNMYLSFTKIT